MIHFFEIEVALLWSIKKETFMNRTNNSVDTETKKTAVQGYEFEYGIEQRDGYVIICFADESSTVKSKIKEMTLSIPSANFKGDFTKKPDVPKDHMYYSEDATVAIKSDDFFNPEKNFFVNDILTMEFRGIIDCNEEPDIDSLSEMLWHADDNDFTFIIGEREIKAHKFILRRYSSVFTEMFNSNTDQIKINDFVYDVLYDALCFCYDFPVDNSPVDRLLECLRFADVYDMPIIKVRISNKLARIVDTNNLCKIANKSLEYNAPTLKDDCINFISQCQRNGIQYDDALNLNIQIVHELYKASLLRTETS